MAEQRRIRRHTGRTGARSDRRRLWRLLASISLGAAFIAGAFAAAAHAYHIPGATYNGTHSFGGTVSFTVTPDGSGLSSFSATGSVPGNICTFSGGSTTTYVVPLPILDHAFSDSRSTTTKSGSFSAVRSASGQFQIRTIGPFACSSPAVTWNATTTASPAGSEECKSANAAVLTAKTAVARAKKAVARARKAVKRAATAKARAKAKKKLKSAKRKLRNARNKLKEAQNQEAPVCG